MLDSERESLPKKITLSHDHLKNSTPLHEAPEDPALSQPLVELKGPVLSAIGSKDTQKSTLSSDCTMSDESQQDHSLSPSSKYSPPRADETLKDTSSQSDELSQDTPSKDSSHSSHISLSRRPNSTESGLTQSSEEENTQEKEGVIVSEQVPTFEKSTQNKEDCTAEKTISLPVNSSTLLHQNSEQKAINSEQLLVSLDLSLEKFEKVIGQKQDTERKQETDVPEKTILTTTNSETSLSEPLALTSSISNCNKDDFFIPRERTKLQFTEE
jgi:hypothetical protein